MRARKHHIRSHWQERVDHVEDLPGLFLIGIISWICERFGKGQKSSREVRYQC